MDQRFTEIDNKIADIDNRMRQFRAELKIMQMDIRRATPLPMQGSRRARAQVAAARRRITPVSMMHALDEDGFLKPTIAEDMKAEVESI